MVAAAGFTAVCATSSATAHLSSSPPPAPVPPTPAESAIAKLKKMKEHFKSSKSLNTVASNDELTYDEFFQVLGMDPDQDLAAKISTLADANSSGTITLEEYFKFAELINDDTLFASLLLDLNSDGTVSREELNNMLARRGERSERSMVISDQVLDTLFEGKSCIDIQSNVFRKLLFLLEEDVLERGYVQVADDGTNGGAIGSVSASDLVVALSNQGFNPSEKLVDAVFKFCQKQPTQTVSRSQFRALFKALRQVPKIERMLKRREVVDGESDSGECDSGESDSGESESSREFTKKDYREYLLRVSPNISNVDEAVNICFEIFDQDRSDSLSLKELRVVHDNSVLSSGMGAGGENQKKMTTMQSLGIGAVSGAAGSIVVFPIYKVKTRLQSIPSSDGRGAFRQVRRTYVLSFCRHRLGRILYFFFSYVPSPSFPLLLLFSPPFALSLLFFSPPSLVSSSSSCLLFLLLSPLPPPVSSSSSSSSSSFTHARQWT